MNNSIIVSVWTKESPKNIIAKNEEWDALLGQFENGERVRITVERIGENKMKTADAIRAEVRRRLGIVKDNLIGQSPEDVLRHYKTIGMQDAFRGILEFIDEDEK